MSVDMKMLDCATIPEFYVTTIGKTEDAGGGCVRSYVCIERGRLLIPRYTFVMPAQNIAAATMAVQRAALEIFSMPNLAPH